jgi:hypothetical protein
MNAPRATHEAGFSLAEMLVAVVAAITILGAVFSLTIQHSQKRQADLELTAAYVACLHNLERMRSLPLDQIAGMDGVDFDVPGTNGEPGGLNAVGGDPDGFAGEISVTLEGSSGGWELWRVRVSVVWTGSQRRREFAMETLLGPRQWQ